MEFCKIFDFLKPFRRLDPPWNTAQKKFPKKVPQNLFKTLLDNLGTTSGVFGILKIFYEHFKDSTLHGLLCKKNFPKNTPKHVQNTFGQIGNDCGRFLNFESFLKTFRRLDPPWNTGQKNFLEKITPKHVQNTFGHFRNDYDHFWNFARFLIFWNHFEDSTLHGTLRKKKFRKKYPKTCSEHFWTIWERLRAFLEFLKFFMNISKTRPSMDYCAKKFSKKIPQSMFKTRLDKLGTTVGVFWILKVF